MSQYINKPKKCHGEDIGWWYANKGGIEIHVPSKPGRYHHIVKIQRNELIKYLEKTDGLVKGK